MDEVKGIVIIGVTLHWRLGILCHREPAGETSSLATSHPDQTHPAKPSQLMADKFIGAFPIGCLHKVTSKTVY